MSTRVQERFSPVPPQTRVFEADRRMVYAAGQAAVKDIGLMLGRTSLTDGRIDAYAPIRAGDNLRDTRQTTMQVRFSEAVGGTEVALLVFESTEGNFPGGVSEQALRQHSLYVLYFSALEQALLKSAERESAGKP